jgi:hypothetical protein
VAFLCGCFGRGVSCVFQPSGFSKHPSVKIYF